MGPLCDAEQFVRVPTVVGATVDARRNTSVAALHTNELTLCNNNTMATKNSQDLKSLLLRILSFA